ncbi:MAG TPA: DUF2017 family protein [Acidimicrobiales bacterium]|nr:DUF2017 family protein [Acidimicrobiales bacterium]
MLGGPRIRRTAGGRIKVRIRPEERAVLADLPGQLRELMTEGAEDPSLRRLFPPAYLAEPDHDREYHRLMGDDLRERHLASLAVMEASAHAEELTDEEAAGWLSALNNLRLVIGTRLDVSEEMDDGIDPDDPRAPGLALYGYLSLLTQQLVDALEASLPST